MKSLNRTKQSNFLNSSAQSKSNDFFLAEARVEKCKQDLKKYFHPQNTTLSKRFEIIYKIFGLNDEMIARELGIDRTTMNRYRRGVFIPVTNMKRLISQAITKLCNYPVDSSVLWGSDLFFQEWKENKLKGLGK